MRLRKAALAGFALVISACSSQRADMPASADAARGRLLYEGACSTCHTTQPHWREKRFVDSWRELVLQVDRWQRVAHQSWSAAEINDVAAFLNERFYKLPCPLPGCRGPRARGQPAAAPT
jgi:mono/diheme cytochrome c family protein